MSLTNYNNSFRITVNKYMFNTVIFLNEVLYFEKKPQNIVTF